MRHRHPVAVGEPPDSTRGAFVGGRGADDGGVAFGNEVSRSAGSGASSRSAQCVLRDRAGRSRACGFLRAALAREYPRGMLPPGTCEEVLRTDRPVDCIRARNAAVADETWQQALPRT